MVWVCTQKKIKWLPKLLWMLFIAIPADGVMSVGRKVNFKLFHVVLTITETKANSCDEIKNTCIHFSCLAKNMEVYTKLSDNFKSQKKILFFYRSSQVTVRSKWWATTLIYSIRLPFDFILLKENFNGYFLHNDDDDKDKGEWMWTFERTYDPYTHFRQQCQNSLQSNITT